MTDMDAFIERNEHYATTGAHEGLLIYPAGNICVITCLDPRTDPVYYLEIEAGEALVIRNAGGRVTQAVLDDLALITYLSETIIKPEGALFEVAIVHHNKCGTHFLADPEFRHTYAAHVDGDDAALADEAVVDPQQTVRGDVELVRGYPHISQKITVSGHVYDVDTGVLTTLIPALPMLTV